MKPKKTMPCIGCGGPNFNDQHPAHHGKVCTISPCTHDLRPCRKCGQPRSGHWFQCDTWNPDEFEL